LRARSRSARRRAAGRGAAWSPRSDRSGRGRLIVVRSEVRRVRADPLLDCRVMDFDLTESVFRQHLREHPGEARCADCLARDLGLHPGTALAPILATLAERKPRSRQALRPRTHVPVRGSVAEAASMSHEQFWLSVEFLGQTLAGWAGAKSLTPATKGPGFFPRPTCRPPDKTYAPAKADGTLRASASWWCKRRKRVAGDRGRSWMTVCGLLLCVSLLSGCGVSIPPLYSAEEVKAICDRRGGCWRSDGVWGGYCEYKSP
jgi:hypothetical protein